MCDIRSGRSEGIFESFTAEVELKNASHQEREMKVGLYLFYMPSSFDLLNIIFCFVFIIAISPL